MTMLSPKPSTVYKAEVMHRREAWSVVRGCRIRDAGMGGLVHNRRLLEPIGNIPPTEAEERYYAMMEQPAIAE